MKQLKIALHALYEMLPSGGRDRVLAIWMRSPVRRMLRRRRADKVKAVKQEAIARFGRFGAGELGDMLRGRGIQQGDIVFVQCSFNDLHTLQATPLETLKVLEDLVGPTGTLLMPAYTSGESSMARPFKPEYDATYTGILSEVFRRAAGVERSLHPRHSICGRGPDAARILAGHESCPRADGPDSPFDRLRRLPNAKILTLGLPPGHISFLHWVEDFEPEKLPFRVYRQEPVTSAVQTADGRTLPVLDWHVKSDVAARLSLRPVVTQLSAEACNFFQYKGVAVGIYAMPILAKELLSLRDRGTIHYS
jgi:aminoglycoside N3'-acetyltransferase